MTQDEFEEYRYIIQHALAQADFNDGADIVKAEGTICIFSRRSRDIAVAITPRGPELNIMYFDCGFRDDAHILNLAAPDSILALGWLIKDHLKVHYGEPQSKTNLG